MKKTVAFILVVLFVVFSFVSCKQDPVVQVQPTPTIRGTVSIPSGADLSGRDFYIRVMEGEKAVYTGRVNADGSFSVPGLSEEATYNILLTTEEPGDITDSSRDISRATKTSGYGGWLSNVTASINEQAGVGSIKVKPLGTIKGVVKKDGAEDNYDTTVYIPGTSYLSMTDGEGNFSLFNVPQATYTLRYISNGYMAKMVDNVVLYSESDTENPVTTVQRETLIKNAGSIEGFALRDGEIDNSGITLRLEQENSTVNLTATTAENGYFRIDDVPPGSYRVLASYAGYPSQASSYVTVAAAKLTTIRERIELAQNTGTITGSAGLSGSNQKGGISISIVGIDSERRYSTVTAEDGSFRKDVTAGQYRITATYPGFNSKSMEVTVVQGYSQNVDTGSLVSSFGAISGRIILEGSVDASGVVITITDSSDPTRRYSTITDSQGSYLISGIPLAGNYLIECTKEGYLKNNSSSVDVSIGSVSVVSDVIMKSLMSKVIGQAHLEGTEDYTGISVLLKATDNSVQYDATTDQQGSYVMARVKPGEYTLTVSKAGYVSKTVNDIIVESSTEKTLDYVSLNIGTRFVSGNVTLELRSDCSGALVAATNLSDPTVVYSAISNTEGNYTLAGMMPGEYVISVSCAGYNTATLPTINITEGTETTLDSFELKIARGTISGSATLEGRGTNAGIRAELMKGTDVYATTTTDDSGLYSFSVPQGNYSGVRLTCENFKSVSIAQSIALIANDYVTIGGEGISTLMVATHVPVVRGRLTVKDLLSLDYSGIAVTLKENDMSTTTDHDGYWSFGKVPVGHYTLKFERENTNPVTMAVDIVASAEKNIETIELIPNAASIEGHVTINGLTDHSGVTVRATAEGMAELTTRTNAAGYFYIGNVVTTETYTVHFEKAGWVSQTRQVSGLEDLSLNDITEADPITLIDTTAPVLNSVSITVGNSELEGRKLNVYMDAVEEGSGLAKVYVNTTNDFTGVEPISYANPISCYVPDIEGSYTLYVKVEDKSGNLSATETQAFSIADYKTVVSSVILDNEDGVNDGIVTWTKAKSPYYVTGNILVDENTTLIIEPGVNVQFSGAYYIQVEGSLKINGTENEKVYLYGVGDGEDTWTGINGVKESGNVIQHAVITGMALGLRGYLRVVDSALTAGIYGYALGTPSYNQIFRGRAEDCNINGRMQVGFASLLRNQIKSTYDDYSVYKNTYQANIESSYLFGNEFSGIGYGIYGTLLVNNYFNGTKVYSIYSGMMNCSFVNSVVEFGGTYCGGLYKNCIFDSCSFGDFNPAIVNSSNFINCDAIKTTTPKSTFELYKLAENYWGVSNTNDLIQYGLNYNHLFLIDFFDDFTLTRFDVSSFATNPHEGIGYLDNGCFYSSTSESLIDYRVGDIGPAGGIVFYDKGYYSEGWRYLEVAPDNLEGNITFGYYKSTEGSEPQKTGTGIVVGTGQINTLMLVETMRDNAYTSDYDFINEHKTEEYAAKLCADYSFNGYDDWFLPSRDELRLIYENLKKDGFSNFDNGRYWSSSELSSNLGSDSVFALDFQSGNSMELKRYYYAAILPIRAF